MHPPESTATIRRRYGWLASIYDLANFEGMLYAYARARAIELLDLRPGARVLDVACGTGAESLAEPFDAAVCTLGLSVIQQWPRAWEAMKSSVRPGGRLAIMDAGYPEDRGEAMLARSIAWALSRRFAADCSRRPWRLLQRDTANATSERFTLGWVTTAAGTAAAR